MSTIDEDARVQAGLDRRFAVVDSLIPPRPPWRAEEREDSSLTLVRASAGPTLRGRPQGRRTFATLVAVLVILVVAVVGLVMTTGAPISPGPTPTASASPEPPATDGAGMLRPLLERRLSFPVRPSSAWTLVENEADMLGLIYLLDDVGSGGYNVGLLVVEPRGVYDPVDEEVELPLPPDLIAWIKAHPDLDAEEPFELTVAGLPATAIDVTVTYPKDGPKGETAQFIDIGPGSWNLESPSKKRIVLVQLPDRPMLIVFESRPEFFDAGISAFETEISRIQFDERGASP